MVIGCLVGSKDWALEVWFESVRRNVEPEDTGLIFVVPPTETPARDIINEQGEDFAFVEVMRDKRHNLEDEQDTMHSQHAAARNQMLRHLPGLRPSYYLAWDPDFLLPSRLATELMLRRLDAATVWTWLNRRDPEPCEFEGDEYVFQRPVQATAMKWAVAKNKAYADHYPSDQFNRRAKGIWPAAVITEFMVLSDRAWPWVRYEPHPNGESIPVNWQLEKQKIDRYCCGERVGLHLPEYRADEIDLGYPAIMKLTEQRPLQVRQRSDRDPALELMGLYEPEGTTA